MKAGLLTSVVVGCRAEPECRAEPGWNPLLLLLLLLLLLCVE
jgi:hypothetical protein